MSEHATVRSAGRTLDPGPFKKGFGFSSVWLRVLDAVRRWAEEREARLIIRLRAREMELDESQAEKLFVADRWVRDAMFPTEKIEEPTRLELRVERDRARAAFAAADGDRYAGPRFGAAPPDPEPNEPNFERTLSEYMRRNGKREQRHFRGPGDYEIQEPSDQVEESE